MGHDRAATGFSRWRNGATKNPAVRCPARSLSRSEYCQGNHFRPNCAIARLLLPTDRLVQYSLGMQRSRGSFAKAGTRKLSISFAYCAGRFPKGAVRREKRFRFCRAQSPSGGGGDGARYRRRARRSLR